MFGSLEWSNSETHLLYVAEKKVPEAKSFFNSKSDDGKETTEAADFRVGAIRLLRYIVRRRLGVHVESYWFRQRQQRFLSSAAGSEFSGSSFESRCQRFAGCSVYD